MSSNSIRTLTRATLTPQISVPILTPLVVGIIVLLPLLQPSLYYFPQSSDPFTLTQLCLHLDHPLSPLEVHSAVIRSLCDFIDQFAP